MKITDNDGNEIVTMGQWEGLIRPIHWKPGHSAYTLADFVMKQNGARVLEERLSSVLLKPVTLLEATPEYGAAFDKRGQPSNLDLGIFGSVGSISNLFVGVEAKVNESFGDKTVCGRYKKGIRDLACNPRSKAAVRVEGLLSQYFSDTSAPCDSKFADVGYQLLTGTAGTIARRRDTSVFYILVFKTSLYNERKARNNLADYRNFIEAAGGKELTHCKDVFFAHEVRMAGDRLICIYDYVEDSEPS